MALGGWEEVGMERPRLKAVGASGGEDEGVDAEEAAQGRGPLLRRRHRGSPPPPPPERLVAAAADLELGSEEEETRAGGWRDWGYFFPPLSNSFFPSLLSECFSLDGWRSVWRQGVYILHDIRVDKGTRVYALVCKVLSRNFLHCLKENLYLKKAILSTPMRWSCKK